MKKLSTLALTILFISTFGQHFELGEPPKTVYTKELKSYLSQAVLTSSNQLVYGKDEIEIVDVHSGDLLYHWDPKGKYGTSTISNDGKYVANRSQNYDHPDLGYVDVFQVLNTETKQAYMVPVPDELWQKMGFANTREEVAIQTSKYDGTDDKVRLITFDFVNGNEINTLFKSSKSSTVILDIEYSLDDQFIYATIAFGSSVSTFYVFDATSGEVRKKVELPHQCDVILVREDKIFLSGAHGINTTEYITILSSKDFSEIKEWKGENAYNVDPKGEYFIKYNWEDKNLYTFDLTSGEEKLLMEGKDMNFYILASSFDPTGNYFAIARDNSYEYYQKNKDLNKFPRAYIFDNSLIKNSFVSESVQNDEDEPSVNSNSSNAPDKWISYSHANPQINVNLPAEAKVKEEKNSKGHNTITITGATETEAAMISAIEIPTIKKKKYTLAAKKIGEDFIKKKSPTEIKKTPYSYKDQEGIQYTFRIGKFEYIYRVFCVDGYAYQLFYLAPTLAEVDYDTFLNSFKLK
ncbi:hypothetical protein [Parvicella tangerina]|uniref:Uncharacterized protein n=1 Tax=Parvicella tangerina TaxID=2829795 RepID=A0A916NCY9_9FLAO|nr:hypothetical protein [Parvicella tangerina]CAG5085978.1 hypothetical protein CRYO30217_02958 [Parvicella tangerina]